MNDSVPTLAARRSATQAKVRELVETFRRLAVVSDKIREKDYDAWDQGYCDGRQTAWDEAAKMVEEKFS